MLDIGKRACHKLFARALKTPQQYQEMFPVLFKGGLGRLKYFIHIVRTRTLVTTVQQRFRSLPLTFQDKVFSELQKLGMAGVIERINASE